MSKKPSTEPWETFLKHPWIRRVRDAAQFADFVVREFAGSRCPVRAAALSYATLLAMVPLLAVVLSVSKQFLQSTSADLVPKLMNQLVSHIAPALDVSLEAKQQAVEQIQSFIGNIHAGTLGTLGSLLLIVVAVRLLTTIEATFNDIWGVRKGRSVWRKIVYYWTTVTLGPVLLFGAIYLTGRFEFSGLYGKLRFAAGLERWFFQLLPFIIVWAGFSLMYALMPNTYVRPRAAIIGGVVAGTLWQVNSLLSTLYVSRVVSYSKIYGALGIIPLFLVGLYFSWLIVLLGAQVSFAAQNARSRRQQRASEKMSQHQRELVACRLVLTVCADFTKAATPPSVEALSDHLDAPVPLLHAVVQRLVEAGLIREVVDEPPGLLPARPTEAITVADVLDAMRMHSDKSGPSAGGGKDEPLLRTMEALGAAQHAAQANVSFNKLVAAALSPKV